MNKYKENVYFWGEFLYEYINEKNIFLGEFLYEHIQEKYIF